MRTTFERYDCEYTSGDGTVYSEGLWRIKTLTDKTLIVKKIDNEGFYSYYEKGDEIKCGRIKQNGNTLREWGDGTFTIYPDQEGMPFYFRKEGEVGR